MPSVSDDAPTAELVAVLLMRMERALAELKTAPAVLPPDPLHGHPDGVLTDAEVASVLKVPESHVAQLRREGKLPTVMVGTKYPRIRRGDVIAYVQAQVESGHRRAV